MRLEDLQRDLAASLAGRGPSPEGLDERALERTRRSLESKRRGAAAHLLPRLRKALGDAWAQRFHEHAGRYIPDGLLHHVDDAWELAETLRKAGEPKIRKAAQSDLTALRLRYVRNPKAGSDRIRERRGFLVALTRSPGPTLVIRLPGGSGRVWTLRLPFRRKLWLLLSLFLLQGAQMGCKQEPSAPPALRAKPGPWLTVDAAALRLAQEGTIYHQGPAPPILHRRAPVEIPVDAPDALPQGTVIVEAVITREGKVAQARMLRAPPIAGLSTALVEALREWRFEPARLKGEPVAVYYTLTLRSEPRPASSEPQKPWVGLYRPKTEPQPPGQATH